MIESDETCTDVFRNLGGFEDLLAIIEKIRKRLSESSSGKEEMDVSPPTKYNFDKRLLLQTLRVASQTMTGSSVASIIDSPLINFVLDVFNHPISFGGSVFASGIYTTIDKFISFTFH